MDRGVIGADVQGPILQNMQELPPAQQGWLATLKVSEVMHIAI